MELYPLKFVPQLKTLVWGGEKIAPYKGIETTQRNVGESWELSGVKGNESVVAEGPLAGKTITEILAQCKGRLVGEKVYAQNGTVFPLLIKFIDARDDLSIQVHPNDELAARRHNGSKGKTEMWYVVDAEPGAHLLAGLSAPLDPETYAAKVADGSITDVLARHEVHPGDVFFLPAGRIHAICGGCFIAEIQQTSDITYRIFDYNRPGLDGKPRQLHTEEAKEAIDYTVYPEYRTSYTPAPDGSVEVVRCPYFTTSVLELEHPYEKDLHGLDSFVVLMCLQGHGVLEADGASLSLRRGETALIPAETAKLKVIPAEAGMTLLESHV